MHKIFISGSMKIKKLHPEVINRVNNIINSGYQVLVGDADGVDHSIQQYLYSQNINTVSVYCSGDQPRNNVGSWETKMVFPTAPSGTRAFFTEKDIKMADDCDYGFMIWDTKSTGTLSNIIELLKRDKLSLVFVNKECVFYKVKTIADFEVLLKSMNDISFTQADKKINLSKSIEILKNQQCQLF